MDRNKFLEERRAGIGGSDVASLVAAELPELNLRPFKTPLEVYYSKILKPEDTEPTIEQQRGINAEDLVAELYLSKNTTKNESYCIIDRSPLLRTRNSFMLAHPDKIIGRFNPPFETFKPLEGCHILECKTVHHSKADQWKTQAPTEFWLQCVHYAIVCDVPFVDIAGMIGFEGLSGDDEYFKIYRYERDKKLEQRIIDIEERFWENHVLKKKPPAPMNNADYNLLNIPHDKKVSITATKEIEEAVAKYKFLSEAVDKYDKEKKAQSLLIKNYMGEAYTLQDTEGQKLGICFNKNNPQKLDKEKLKTLISEEDYNSLLSEPSQSTIFQLTKRKQS